MIADETTEFATLWDKMEGICISKALQAMSRGDAEDLVSEYSFSVWSMLQTPSFLKGKNDAEHAKAYLIKIFKYRIIDFLRDRKRRNVLMDNYGQVQPQYHLDDTLRKITKKELGIEAFKISDMHGKVIALMLEGLSYREIGKKLGYGASQIARYARDGMARLSSDERVSGGEGGNAKSNHKEVTMAKVKMSYKQKGNVLKVVVDKKVIALVTVSDAGDEIEGIEVRKGGPVAKDSIVSGVCQHLGIKTKKAGDTEPKAEKKAPAKAKVKKEAGPMLLPIDPIDMTEFKDFPKNLELLQKKMGGEGYCLGGSGLPVGRRFKPGYDAKLKSQLKRVGTANAKAIAEELGWSKLIRWND